MPLLQINDFVHVATPSIAAVFEPSGPNKRYYVILATPAYTGRDGRAEAREADVGSNYTRAFALWLQSELASGAAIRVTDDRVVMRKHVVEVYARDFSPGLIRSIDIRLMGGGHLEVRDEDAKHPSKFVLPFPQMVAALTS